MKVALDIDGVVSDFSGNFSRFLNEECDIDFSPEKVTQWEWWECPGRPKGFDREKFEECFRAYADMGWFDSQPLYPDAIDAVVRLKENGHDIRFFTWRPESGTPETLAGCPVTRCEGPAGKAEAAKAWGAQLLIDDSPESVLACVKAGLDAFLFPRLHNKGYRGEPIPCMSRGWADILAWVKNNTKTATPQDPGTNPERADYCGIRAATIPADPTGAVAAGVRVSWAKRHGHPRFYALLETIAELHDRKNHDYAGDGDPLKNLRSCERMGIPAWVGCAVRLQDKASRLEQFVRQRELKVKGESIKDTLMDNAVYSLLAIVLLEEAELNDRPNTGGAK